jgi:hypothetical protein
MYEGCIEKINRKLEPENVCLKTDNAQKGKVSLMKGKVLVRDKDLLYNIFFSGRFLDFSELAG